MITGLTSFQVQTLLERFGRNELKEQATTTPIKLFISQFTSPLVIILFIATAASLILGDTLEGILIFLIVLLNAILGFVQEYRAERALAALKHMTVSTVRVIRAGVQSELDSALLVPGDIILIEEGDKVPADAKVLEALHLEVNEAALTGESLPVEKVTGSGDDKELVLMGTVVSRGRATVQVTATGMRTRFGGIAAKLTAIEKEETPLEKKLGGVAKQLGVLASIAAAAILVIGFFRQNPFLEILLTAISLAVAAVPEGLPAVITITLAIGTQRMAKKRAILRKLAAIEALGSITVIATDKTGTLTKNQMHVVDVWIDGHSYAANDRKLSKSLIFQKLIAIGVLCNNASLAPRKDHGGFEVIGDQTEGSLLLLASDHGANVSHMKEQGKLVEEFAFDPVTKTMTVVWRGGDGTHILTKGAPESILERSKRILTAKGEKALSHKDKEDVYLAFEEFAKSGLRVIALAFDKRQWNKHTRQKTESDLTFIGFVGIADPAREEVPESIREAEEAGIRTLMITGDNELTAYAIAKKIGLLKKGDEVLTGKQLSELSDTQCKQLLPRVRVFARTTPEQKLRIVQLLQELGHVVAVTGDGVNDALALKQANVGVAMGITGTDVAKEAAEMVITDDNYATIVEAVAEGRVIFDNMKAAIKYLIGCNIGEVIALVGGSLLGWPFILAPLHILYVNLVTDGFPAIALALTPRHHGIMNRKPRTDTNLFTRFDLRWFAEVSSLTAATTLYAFYLGWRQEDPTLARTLAFAIIILAQQFIFWDVAVADRSLFSGHALKNKWVMLPLAIIAGQLLLMYTPAFNKLFSITHPTANLLLFAAFVCAGMFLVAEFRKQFVRRFFYDS